VRLSLDRRLRGIKEVRKLRRADAVVVSHPKCGRTWVRALLSYYYSGSRNLAVTELLGFDNYNVRDRTIPRIFFTHDNYLVDVTGEEKLLASYAARPVVLLVRDPRDWVVSAFHQTSRRGDRLKQSIRGKDAPHLRELSAFLRDPVWGLERYLRFLERWAERMDRLPRSLLVRYEDLHADTAGGLERLLGFLGEGADPHWVRHAVAEASFERMREKERSGTFGSSSRRFGAPVNDPNAFKVREGRVGGWRRWFAEADVEWIERTMAERMPRGFGYRDDERIESGHAVIAPVAVSPVEGGARPAERAP